MNFTCTRCFRWRPAADAKPGSTLCGDCRAKLAHRRQPGRPARLRRDDFLSEVEHLLGTDTPENIAARMGYGNTPRSFVRRLFRYGRGDLAARFQHLDQHETA